MKTMKKLLLLSSILLLSCFAFTGCGTKKLNLNKYISAEFSGYNGFGNAQVEFDRDAFEEDCAKIKIKNDRLSAWYGNAADYYHDFCIAYTLDIPEDLENGDVITLTWNCDPALARENTSGNLVFEDMELEVEGLEVVSQFDIFEGVSIEYGGAVPTAYAKIVYEETDDFSFSILREGDFMKYSQIGHIYEGEVITIEATMKELTLEETIKEYGGLPKTMKKEVTVPALPGYVQKLSDVSKEHMAELETKAKAVLAEKQQYLYEDADYCEVKLVETAVGYYPDTSLIYLDNPGKVYFIYELTYPGDNGFTYYTYVFFNDVINNLDGTMKYKEENIEYPSAKTGFWGFVTGEGFMEDNKLHLGFKTMEELKDELIEYRHSSFDWDIKTE